MDTLDDKGRSGQDNGECIICGGEFSEGDDNHNDSDKHRLGQARMAIDSVDRLNLCPWCEELTKFKKCRVAEHKRALEYCRNVVVELSAGRPMPTWTAGQ